MVAILFALVAGLSAQITNVRVEPTHAQAVIHYSTLHSGSCAVLAYDMNRPIRITDMTFDTDHVTVTTALNHGLHDGSEIVVEGSSVSAWNAQQNVLSVSDNRTFLFSTGDSGSSSVGVVGVLVNDVDTTLFADSHLDSRYAGNTGSARTFILGTRKSEVSSGVSYSRALQVNSRHKFFISCGADTYVGEFYTRNLPLGSLAVDVPLPASPGLSAWPTLDKAGRWEKSNGVWYDPVIDPITGVLYNQMYPPEIPTDTAFVVSTTNTPTPTGSNWTNPGNVRTQDATNATYAAATQDPLCVRPYRVRLPQTSVEANWYEAYQSLESIAVTVRASGAGATQSDRDIEIALSNDGCQTAGTEWKTLSPSGSLGDLTFPSGTPKAGFGDWHSASQRRWNHIDVVPRRGFVDTNGTAVTLDAALGAYTWPVTFDVAGWKAGSKIRIGGTTDDTCDVGTEYDIASVENLRALTLQSSAGTQSNQWFCASNFAVMVRKKSTSTDQINLDYVTFSLRTGHQVWQHDSGSAKIWGEAKTPDGNGNPGYLSYSNGGGGSANTIHWVSTETGESRFIMAISSNLPAKAGSDGWSSGGCLSAENSFLNSDPQAFICLLNRTGGGQVLAEFKIWWDGTGKFSSQTGSTTPFSTCTTTSPASPNPCLESTAMSAGYPLTDLIQDRNPEFDPSKYPSCSIRGIQSHFAVLLCNRSIQDTHAWIAAYDLDKPIGSYDPMDQSTNPLVGAVHTSSAGIRGIAVLHAGGTVAGSTNLIMFTPKFGRKNSGTDQNGEGPWAMQVVSDAAINTTTDVSSCPANQWNHTNCSTIHVTSEPFDPDPGAGDSGAAGEYGNVNVGDGVLFWKCSGGTETYSGIADGCNSYANAEYGRVLEKLGTAPDITLTVARGITSSGMKSHVSGYRLYSYPITDGGFTLANINAVWDFQNDPTGSLGGITFVKVPTNHTSVTGRALAGNGDATGYGQIVYRNPTVASVAGEPDVNMRIPTYGWPTFNGKTGFRFANTIQQYYSSGIVDVEASRPNAYNWYLDSRPFMSIPGSDFQPLYTKVAGATYIYKYKNHQSVFSLYPYLKMASFYATVGPRILTEKSGADVTLSDNSTDHWKVCVVDRPDECWSGSQYGDVYFNVPYLSLTSLSDYSCFGGYSFEDTGICAAPLDGVLGPNIEFYYGNSNTMASGRHLRRLGWGLVEHGFVNKVPKILSDGSWVGPTWTHFQGLHRSGGLLMKHPPIPPEDGIDRTRFVPMPMSVGSVPPGTLVAQVEFGYNDFGTPAQLYCTARQESCLATASSVLPIQLQSTSWSTSFAWSYASTTAAATTPVRLTFTSPHKFTSDVRLRGSTSASGNNPKLWNISIVDSTKVDLTDSVNGDVTAGTVTAMVHKVEAPFAFSGESFSVAGATNASPIEISTTTMHRFQTGSRVCISGVGGNTDANGCWQITATGPSSFTLDGSTASGSYTSGGTVTPGGVSCASGCTVVVPGVTGRVMHYRWRYLDSTGALVATGATNTTTVP